MEEEDGDEWYIFRTHKRKSEEGDYETAGTKGGKRLKGDDMVKVQGLLKSLGWKHELTSKETKVAKTKGDAVAGSVIGELKQHEVTMAKLLKEAGKVHERMVEGGCDNSKTDALFKSCRDLRKSCNEYEDAIQFKVGADGEALTNSEAFAILGRGGEALKECLEEATVAKSLLNLRKVKAEKK